MALITGRPLAISKWLALAIIMSTVMGASTDPLAPSIAPQDSHHWQKLEKVCETGRKTYGANEFVENGKVCRWTFVPYWPADRKADK